MLEPVSNISGRRAVVRSRPAAVQYGQRIQAIGIGKPAIATRGNAGEAPTNVIAAPKLGFFRDQQAKERPSDISETNDGKVVGRNLRSSAAA
jgi:hypothetical protein